MTPENLAKYRISKDPELTNESKEEQDWYLKPENYNPDRIQIRLNQDTAYVRKHMIRNDEGDQFMSNQWAFMDDVTFVSESHVFSYIGQMLKINKENILERSGQEEYNPKQKDGLIDDTKSGFEKFADSIGVEIIKEEKPGFNPLNFLRD